MTNTGGTPAGWYHAPGDPEGTQRYWDGAQWIGEPQAQQATPPAGQTPASDATVSYNSPPSADPGAGQPPQYGGAPGGTPPSYGAQPPSYGSEPPPYGSVPPGAGAPPGYTAFGGAGAAGAVGVPAEFGQRAIAFLIDIAPIVAGYILVVFVGLISDVLGLLLTLVFWVAAMAYQIWNLYIVQGKTGQSIGKKQQGIKLVLDQTGAPVGGGMAFVRYLASGAFILACCIGYPINLLSPLWNADKKTYSDKIMKMSVVRA